MNAQERREKLFDALLSAKEELSGSALAARMGVSRQIIVQDIALLRANGSDIISTSRGYMLKSTPGVSRVFKVRHSDEDTLRELFLIADYGGRVEDVFIYHRVFGVMKAQLNIGSRYDAELFIKELQGGNSGYLKNVTSGYHYHTVTARDEAMLDLIEQKLWEAGFLAKLKEYEPVKFGK